MTKELMSLDDFSKKYKIFEGEWELNFSDDNYIPTNKFIKLGKVIFDDISKENFDDDFENIYNSFTIHINDQKQIMASLEECWDGKCNLKEDEKIRFIDALFQEISKSLIRVGIIIPDIDERVFNEMQKANILTIVYDTNALVNGTINYLLYELENQKILNIIPKFSQLEIQEKASKIKREKSDIKHCQKIADRAFNTNILRIMDIV